MFANTFQSGFISIFYSVGSSPLSLWDKQVSTTDFLRYENDFNLSEFTSMLFYDISLLRLLEVSHLIKYRRGWRGFYLITTRRREKVLGLLVKNGHIRRVIDDEVKSLVLEVSGTNVATTYITCPIKPRASLAIRLPFLVMIVKNMKKYFTFEIQILDDKDMHRRFRVSNFQSTTKVRPFCTTMPIGLSSGWNQIQFNLADFTRRAYGTLYLETMRVQVHANVRIRRIYFADRLYSEDEMPSEYRLFIPLSTHKEAKEKETDRRPSKEQAVDEGPRPSMKPADKVETIEPAAAPPSPVGTEAVLQEQAELHLGGDETDVSEHRAPEGAPPEQSDEMPSDVPVSEEPSVAQTEVPPSEAAPSEAPTEEVKTDDEGGEAPPEGGEAPTEGGGDETAPEGGEITETSAEPTEVAETEEPTEIPVSPPAEGDAPPDEAPPETPTEPPAEAPAEAPAETPAETPTTEGD
ncbi:orf protein [Holotrichia oblita]|uniref:Orf protein n=1 Tax=Holotrichia oblita TaxID=644536 RepID=A0ACB9TBQ3_HOLOL|nr:orf protein [Holotrichia oblita]